MAHHHAVLICLVKNAAQFSTVFSPTKIYLFEWHLLNVGTLLSMVVKWSVGDSFERHPVAIDNSVSFP